MILNQQELTERGIAYKKALAPSGKSTLSVGDTAFLVAEEIDRYFVTESPKDPNPEFTQQDLLKTSPPVYEETTEDSLVQAIQTLDNRGMLAKQTQSDGVIKRDGPHYVYRVDGDWWEANIWSSIRGGTE